MYGMTQYQTSGFAFSPNTVVMVEGAPAGLSISATDGARTVIGRYVPADSNVSNVPSRYVVDVSSFTTPDATVPVLRVTMSSPQQTWTFSGTPNNGAGMVVPFANFTAGVPWTNGEKALAIGVGVVVVGSIAYFATRSSRRSNPSRRR